MNILHTVLADSRTKPEGLMSAWICSRRRHVDTCLFWEILIRAANPCLRADKKGVKGIHISVVWPTESPMIPTEYKTIEYKTLEYEVLYIMLIGGNLPKVSNGPTRTSA